MGRDGTLPGAPEADPRVICHVDVDCFYAACERLREPPLRGEPVVVGMGYEPGEAGGAVATASYEAREFGVESAQAISEALDALPRKVEAATDPDLSIGEAGYYRPVDMEYYESVAAEIKAILHEAAGAVREVSIDEAYLEVTDRVEWGGDPDAFARDLAGRIDREVGVTASVGVAPTMSAAKIASDHDKPEGLVVIEPGDVADFLSPLGVEKIHGVGPVTARELGEMGIETAGELAGADPAALESRFGERGLEIRRYARGEDERPVEPTDQPQSLSRESAFDRATEAGERQRERVELLAADVADRAAEAGALSRTIGIKVVRPPFEVSTRSRTLPGPVADAELVESVALDLFGEFEGERVRKLGVRLSKLSFAEEEQTSLERWSRAREGPARDRPETAAGHGTGQRSLGEFE